MGLDKEKVEQYFIQFNGDSNRGKSWNDSQIRVTGENQ